MARPENPGRGWTLDLKQMAFGDGPLAGRMLGSEFKADKVLLQNTGLHVQSGNDHIHIFLRLKPGQGIEGKTFEWGKDEKEERRPSIHIHVNSGKPPRAQVAQKGYAMRLEFGTEKDRKLPGKIYLCLPDERKSWIAGSFSFDWQ